MKSVLRAEGLTKSFQKHYALEDAQINLRAGEIHSLMGENGAGKSTLIKLLTGIYQPDAGKIFLDGEVVRVPSNFAAQNMGISTVFQEVNLIPTLSIAENIYLGREPRKFGFIDWAAAREGANRAMARLNIRDIDVSAPLEDYPIAIQQMTAIARALDQQAKVLILDEATSSLDRFEVAQLFSVLKKLKAEGLAILFVSHFLDQVYEISDRITVLRNGKFICEEPVGNIDRTTLVSRMMGRELTAAEFKKAEAIAGEAWLSCSGLGETGHMEPFDLEIRRGEVLGLAGLLGSGRTDIARLLFGIYGGTSGSLNVDGKAVKLKSPRDAVASGFALIPEDRKSQAIFPGLTVRENVMLGLQARNGWWRFLSMKKQKSLAEDAIKSLLIRARGPEQNIETLSGGNQQKVILGRWLALDPRLLILDEPTRGIDVGAKAEILKEILALAARDKSIVFISSELEEVVRVSNRIAVLKDRRKIGELNADQISEKAVMQAIGEAK